MNTLFAENAAALLDRLHEPLRSCGAIKIDRIPHGWHGRLRAGDNVVIQLHANARLSVERTLKRAECLTDRLARHADWSGPVKLVEQGDKRLCRGEIALGPEFRTGGRMTLDADSLEDLKRITGSLLRAVQTPGADASLSDWTPPPTNLLVQWLAAGGRDAAVDDTGDLRLALHRKGCDGQVRIRRETGRLRMVMPLPCRQQHPEAALTTAMQRIVAQANDNTRLARVAWHETDGGPCCEGQVDLTGLPWSDRPAVQAMWRVTVPRAADALDVILKRIGLELAVLAGPSGRDLLPLLEAGSRT